MPTLYKVTRYGDDDNWFMTEKEAIAHARHGLERAVDNAKHSLKLHEEDLRKFNAQYPAGDL